MRNTHREEMFSALPPNSDVARCDRHFAFVPTGDIEMKEVAIECPNYVFFLPPTLAMVASRVIGQLQRAYRTLG
jgi:hypothetical protein